MSRPKPVTWTDQDVAKTLMTVMLWSGVEWASACLGRPPRKKPLSAGFRRWHRTLVKFFDAAAAGHPRETTRAAAALRNTTDALAGGTR